MRAVATLVPLLFVAALARPATAQPPLEAARGLLAAWHDDPARIDRARVLLEAEAAADPSADTLVELSRAWLLTGCFRARSAPGRGPCQLAEVYLGRGRSTHAGPRLQAVMAETTPPDRPRWAMRDLPRARAMLFELRERRRVPGIDPESPERPHTRPVARPTG